MIHFWFSKKTMTGGNIYNHMVADALRTKGYTVKTRRAFTGYTGWGHTYINSAYTFLTQFSKPQDLDIMDYPVAARCSKLARGQRIIIMLHFDLQESRKKRKQRFFFNRFLKNAQKAQIVVIANHWKSFLEDKGLKKIEVIPCAFEIERYRQYTPASEFRKQHGLDDRPIIYLGKNATSKTLLSYRNLEALKDDFLLITSGPRREFIGPIHLNLDFKDYCSLLHAASVTVTLPQFDEGWSRIAHESLICGTPVIGSARGGLGELLRATHQLIMKENTAEILQRAVRQIIREGRDVPEEDQQFARSYTTEFFGHQWQTLVNSYLKSSSGGEKEEKQ